MSRLSIQKYKSMKINSAENAEPYELIQIVLSNIIGKLTAAKAYIDRKEIEKKGISVSESITLIGALQDSLDMENGGDISINLFRLYEFTQTKLVEANFENSKDKITEVINIFAEIKSGWDAIPKEMRQVQPDSEVQYAQE